MDSRILPIACFNSLEKLVGTNLDAGARLAGLVVGRTEEDGEVEIGQMLFYIGIHFCDEKA